MKQNQRILIIGGGLSGLTLAYLLSKQNVFATILEASSRLGGRIQTIKGKNETPLELGATWFSDMHPYLNSLLNDLGLDKYPQYSTGKSLFQTKPLEPPQEFHVPETDPSSYRIAGGTESLIRSLSKNINSNNIKLNTKVIAITKADNELIVESDDGNKTSADKVILCLPPQLVGSSIHFSPELSDKVSTILPTVQTWMGGSIKFVLEYSEPFWRHKGYSGMIYSHVGIISEMYDHTNIEGSKYGFTGFLNSGASVYSKEHRKELVLKQLENQLGKEATKPLLYNDKIWNDQYVLGGNQAINIPHQNNGHPAIQGSHMNGKLFFSGTESSIQHAGYMEGAVFSAISAYKDILTPTN